jgi:riboflavin synthase
MFSGIIESTGKIADIIKENNNLTFVVNSNLASELKVDQSVAHNGVCLTVIKAEKSYHWVTAIKETLDKTNLGNLKIGQMVNLERCIRLQDRLDGHLVQGHVDQTAICIDKKDEGGSWLFTFQYDDKKGNITVEKGSICVNGVSLTVVNAQKDKFSVAIIPYTYEYTNFSEIELGTIINLEFDIIGKYIAKLYRNTNEK